MGKKIFLLVVIAGLASTWFIWGKPALEKSLESHAAPAAPSAPAPARVSSIAPETVPVFASGLRENGTIEAVEQVVLRCKVAGRLEKMLVHEGDRVVKGQPLAVIEHDAIAARLAVAQADLEVSLAQMEQSKVSLEDAEREAARYEKLFQDGYCTEQQLTQRRTSLEAARAGLAVAKASVARNRASVGQIRVDLAESTVYAPFAGVVTDDFSHSPGEMIDDKTDIVGLMDPERLYARVNVAEQDAARVTIGMPASISVLEAGEKIFTGAVWRIQPVVDASTRTTRVDVLADDPSLLRPGMFASVFFVEDQVENVTVLPRAAVQGDAPDFFVWIMENSKARKASVTLGPQDGDRVAIRESLPPNARVLVSGAGALKDGDAVAEAGS